MECKMSRMFLRQKMSKKSYSITIRTNFVKKILKYLEVPSVRCIIFSIKMSKKFKTNRILF